MNTKCLWQMKKDQTARLLRIYGETPEAVIPDKIEGVTVTEIADYCFSQSLHLPGETEYRTTFLPAEAAQCELHELSGSYVKSLQLPKTIEKLGRYAFYNCSHLTSITVGAALTEAGSDCFMNCLKLSELHLHADHKKPGALRQILAQITSDLEVFFWQQGQIQLAVFYPEYTESYDEIAPAHIFGRKITGEGFRARQCFVNEVVALPAYDGIFAQACVEEPEKTLCRMAYDRLRYPQDLETDKRKAYEAYLRDHADVLFFDCIRRQDADAVCFLTDGNYVNATLYEQGITLAAEAGWVQGSSLLIGQKRRHIPEGSHLQYSFDAF